MLLYTQLCLSVGLSVSQSVGPLVHHILLFLFFCGLWPHCSCPNDQVTSNTAPAHPHATEVAVYPALFSFDHAFFKLHMIITRKLNHRNVVYFFTLFLVHRIFFCINQVFTELQHFRFTINLILFDSLTVLSDIHLQNVECSEIVPYSCGFRLRGRTVVDGGDSLFVVASIVAFLSPSGFLFCLRRQQSLFYLSFHVTDFCH